jgi:hypothetical protein
MKKTMGDPNIWTVGHVTLRRKNGEASIGKSKDETHIVVQGQSGSGNNEASEDIGGADQLVHGLNREIFPIGSPLFFTITFEHGLSNVTTQPLA